MSLVQDTVFELVEDKGMYGHFVLYPEMGDVLDVATQEKIEQVLLGFRQVYFTKELNFFAFLDSSDTKTYVRVSAFSAEQSKRFRGAKWAWNAIAGTPLSSTGDILVGHELAKQLNCDFEVQARQVLASGYVPSNRPFPCEAEEITLSAVSSLGKFASLNFKIIGVEDVLMPYKSKFHVGMSLASARAFFNDESVSYYFLGKEDGDDLPVDLIARLNGISGVKVKKLIDHKLGMVLSGGSDFVSTFRKFLIAVFLVLGLLCIAAAINKLYLDNQRDYQILRQIGYPLKSLHSFFILEVMFINLVSLAFAAVTIAFVFVLLGQLDIVDFIGSTTQSYIVDFAVQPKTLLVIFLFQITIVFLYAFFTSRMYSPKSRLM